MLATERKYRRGENSKGSAVERWGGLFSGPRSCARRDNNLSVSYVHRPGRLGFVSSFWTPGPRSERGVTTHVCGALSDFHDLINRLQCLSGAPESAPRRSVDLARADTGVWRLLG